MIRSEPGRGVENAILEARRVGRVLTPDLVAALDLHVGQAFAETQARVGVESGALKATGRTGTDIRDDGETWIGWVAYGNDTPPVDYAIYHLAVNEPWFGGIPEVEAAMGEQIDAHLKAHLR